MGWSLVRQQATNQQNDQTPTNQRQIWEKCRSKLKVFFLLLHLFQRVLHWVVDVVSHIVRSIIAAAWFMATHRDTHQLLLAQSSSVFVKGNFRRIYYSTSISTTVLKAKISSQYLQAHSVQTHCKQSSNTKHVAADRATAQQLVWTINLNI